MLDFSLVVLAVALFLFGMYRFYVMLRFLQDEVDAEQEGTGSE